MEFLIHRRLICKTHITIESKPSIYHCAIPILLPCLAILLRWDQEQNDLSVTIYDRVKNQLEERTVILNKYNNDIPDLDGIQSMSPGERRDFVMKYLEMPNELLREWDRIPSDYHLWLMIIRYWYRKRGLEPVYLYAVFICFVEFVFLRTDREVELIEAQLDSLSSALGNGQNRQSINSTTRRQIFKSLEKMRKEALKENSFDRRITHELNCLQCIYIYSLQANKFFNEPFSSSIHPHFFIAGSLFYAFVKRYKAERNLFDAVRPLVLYNGVLRNFIEELKTYVQMDN